MSTAALLAPADDAPLLVNRERAAGLLSIGVGQVDKLIRSGELRSKRIGRRVLVPLTAVQRLASDTAAAEDRT